MSNYIYGIDFGTTNSALAILDLNTNEVIKVFSTPSLLFFPKYQQSRSVFSYSVGQEAVEEYVSSKMEGRFMKSIKRVLPNKGFTHTRIAHKVFKAEDLVALIIMYLKEQADAFLGEEIKSAVIGRPVIFDEKEEKDTLAQTRLSKAVKIAGFEKFYFQMEPIGAAFTYERQLQKPELVLVADLGGGTSDFTLMHLNPSAINNANRAGDMISKGGIYIGGDNFDSALMWHRGTPNFGRGVKEKIDDSWLNLPMSYFTNICSWDKMNFLNSIPLRNAIGRSYVFSGRDQRVKNLQILIDKNLGYSLFKTIEQTKIGLTDYDVFDFKFEQDGIDFCETITIEDFASDIIGKDLSKIEAYLEDYLTKNGLKYADIDTV
ncbi:MAG: putative chaperone protein, partial [Paraglaciecola sp.]